MIYNMTESARKALACALTYSMPGCVPLFHVLAGVQLTLPVLFFLRVAMISGVYCLLQRALFYNNPSSQQTVAMRQLHTCRNPWA